MSGSGSHLNLNHFHHRHLRTVCLTGPWVRGVQDFEISGKTTTTTLTCVDAFSLTEHLFGTWPFNSLSFPGQHSSRQHSSSKHLCPRVFAHEFWVDSKALASFAALSARKQRWEHSIYSVLLGGGAQAISILSRKHGEKSQVTATGPFQPAESGLFCTMRCLPTVHPAPGGVTRRDELLYPAPQVQGQHRILPTLGPGSPFPGQLPPPPSPANPTRALAVGTDQ